MKPVKTYTIPKYSITVEVIDMNGATGGGIKSELKKHIFDGEPTESDFELHGAVHAIESVILGHACAGIDIGSDAYVAGLDSAVEAILNNL